MSEYQRRKDWVQRDAPKSTCATCPDKITIRKLGIRGIKYTYTCGIDSGVIWHLEKIRKDCPLGMK
jgi:hypothetical protein